MPDVHSPLSPGFHCWTVVTVYDTRTAAGKAKRIVNVYSEPDEAAARKVARRLIRECRDVARDGDLTVKVRRAWTIPE